MNTATLYSKIDALPGISKNLFRGSFAQKFCRARKPDEARLCALRGGLTQSGGIFAGTRRKEVFRDALLQNTGKRAVIAIDGGSGAGKSTLAESLAQKYSCHVIHMDDFFLQPFQRTPERLAEIGGNIDYERFAEQVAAPLTAGKIPSYGRYDCRDCTLSPPVPAPDCPLYVVEGVYSLHPRFGEYYDFAVFLQIGAEEQSRRLERRNPALFARFTEEWIPKEQAYFAEFGIAEKCGLVIEATSAD